MPYAEKTSVPSDRSRAEIEKTLARYGADQFIYGWGVDQAAVGFRMAERQVKFLLPMPDKKSDEILKTSAGRRRNSKAQQEAAYEQCVRQKWRALALVIKAKLEAVESGITIFEDEFMAHIVLPNGCTVGTMMRPQIEKAYKSGKMPPLLEWEGK